MRTTIAGVTVEEFLTPGAFPGEAELIDGEVVLTDPTFEHQRVAARIVSVIMAWALDGDGRGEAGFGGNWTLAPDTVVKPDAWWVGEDGAPTGVRSDRPPTLAVEVRSPGNWVYDIGPKRAIYEAAGVAELWLVDTPATAVLVNRRSTPEARSFDLTLEVAAGQALTTPLLAGFALDLAALFA